MPTVLATAILGAGASAFATAMLSFVISYALASIFAPDEPEPAKDQGVQSRVPSDPRNKLPVIYGHARVAGQTVFADISSNNQKMAFIIALGEGPVEAIDRVWWEDKELEMTLNSTPNNPSDAVDHDGKSHSFLNDNLKISVHPTGGRCPAMESFSSRWNSDAANRTLPNLAYAFVELTYDREDSVTGLPSKLYFHVKGRTVDTLQSDGTMTSVITASSNPVDCLIDYLTNTTYGGSIPVDNIDTDSMYTHKVFCDELKDYKESFCSFPSGDTLNSVLIDGADYGNELKCTQQVTDQANFGSWNTAASTSQAKRYSTNGVVRTGEDIDRNISHLTLGNGAVFSYNLGKFGVISEGVTTVAQRDGTNVHFSEDNIVGRISISSTGFDEKLNELTVKFDSVQQRYQEEQVMLEIPVGAAIRNVNEPRLERTLKMNMVNNNVEAKRAGTVLLNQTRQALLVSFDTSLANSDLQAGDLIQISHDTPGWGSMCSDPSKTDEAGCLATNPLTSSPYGTWYDGKPFKIQQVEEKAIEMQGEQMLGIGLTAKEYSLSDYEDLEIQLTDESPNTRFLDPFEIPTLNLTATDSSMADETTAIAGFTVAWDDSTYLRSVDVRFKFKNVPSDPYKYLNSTGTSLEVAGQSVEAQSTYTVEARAKTTVGTTGPWESVEVTTVELESVVPVTITIQSGTDGSMFKNDTGSKILTTNVTFPYAYENGVQVEFDETTAESNTRHAGYDYLWSQDGDVSCVNTGGDVIGTATASVHDTQLSCESAGGYWESTGTVGVTTCRVSSLDPTLFDTQSDTIKGCSTGGFRADSEVSGISGTTLGTFRQINVGAEDVTNISEFTCKVSNI